MTAAPALIPILPASSQKHSAPVLAGAAAAARLDGLLFETRLTQHYRNAGTEALEVQYSFPLPAGATLLGLSVEMSARTVRIPVAAAPLSPARATVLGTAIQSWCWPPARCWSVSARWLQALVQQSSRPR